MKTGCLFTAPRRGLIAISLKVPKHLDGRVKRYERLAPLPQMLRMEKAQYCRWYFGRVLRDLDPHRVWDDLHEIAAGAQPILGCYEKPPFDDVRNWCHRRLVAAWFRDKLGEVVEEIEPARLPGC